MWFFAAIFLALLVLCNGVNAFSEPGAYERLFFYYAYLVDTQGGTKPANKIATGCAKLSGTRNPACSFNEFIKYISPDNKAISDVTRNTAPNVDTTAHLLIEKGITGQYEAGRIRSDVPQGMRGATAVAFAMEGVSNFLQGQANLNDYKTELQESANGITRGRQNASIDQVAEHMRKKGWQLVTRQEQIYQGSTMTAAIWDLRQTATENGKSIEETQEMIRNAKSEVADENHLNIAKLAKKAAATLAEDWVTVAKCSKP
ncbi:uncharacterized protein MYCFIDRAFT_198068 [Pseudocercospora fijiensis CIRAD86]|uniref:Uncharacterized protein n=1 Tax=Pseudocercospora fijiensis (strain CIRAD86) TaxID=383855 RepID=M2ZQG1_PSEFD|nr:uncharacterized protein MYCFIDRAFT_198068 [Pseudocercospora fijiensis CIRAD86]EME81304.1 hypothetical protein MYCFIDRAFT_198068 [Pseudocercospora fijiensis CIRAD86]